MIFFYFVNENSSKQIHSRSVVYGAQEGPSSVHFFTRGHEMYGRIPNGSEHPSALLPSNGRAFWWV